MGILCSLSHSLYFLPHFHLLHHLLLFLLSLCHDLPPHPPSDAADKVVSGEGKFEQLIVTSRDIAASTAQLVSPVYRTSDNQYIAILY